MKLSIIGKQGEGVGFLQERNYIFYDGFGNCRI